jgi:hypothetical protein
VFSLIKWLFWAVALGVFCWFGATVPIGRRTLFGHFAAIARTQEAKDLADGTKEEAERVAKRVRSDLTPDGGAEEKTAHASRGQPSAEKLEEKDRQALRRPPKARSRP